MQQQSASSQQVGASKAHSACASACVQPWKLSDTVTSLQTRAVSIWFLEGCWRDRCKQKCRQQRPIWSRLGGVRRYVDHLAGLSRCYLFVVVPYVSRYAIVQLIRKSSSNCFDKGSPLAQVMQAIPPTLLHRPEAAQSRLLMHTSLNTSVHQALQHLRPCHKLHRLQHQPAMLSMRHCEIKHMKHTEGVISTERCSFVNQ